MKNLKHLIIGIIIGGIIFGGLPVFAFNGTKQIEAIYKEIIITLDGKEVEMDVEPFQYDGRTFVPVRFVSEALGAEVNWKAETNTVEIVSASPTPIPTVTSSPKKEVNTSITYELLARNAQTYKGELVKFTGKVFQPIIGNYFSFYLVNVRRTEDVWDGTVYLTCDHLKISTNFIENEFIDFTGEVVGYYTYTTVSGIEMTVPEISLISASINTSIKKELEEKVQSEKDLERQKVLDFRAELERQHNKLINDLIQERKYHEVRTGESHRLAIERINAEIVEENASWDYQKKQWDLQDKINGY